MQTSGDIAVEGRDLVPAFSRCLSEKLAKALGKHCAPLDEVEVFHLERELAARPGANKSPHLIRIGGLAVGSQAHDLVLAVVDPKAQVGGECGVEQPEGMRKPNFLKDIESVTLAFRIGCGGPFAYAVNSEDRRIIEA